MFGEGRVCASRSYCERELCKDDLFFHILFKKNSEKLSKSTSSAASFLNFLVCCVCELRVKLQNENLLSLHTFLHSTLLVQPFLENVLTLSCFRFRFHRSRRLAVGRAYFFFALDQDLAAQGQGGVAQRNRSLVLAAARMLALAWGTEQGTPDSMVASTCMVGAFVVGCLPLSFGVSWRGIVTRGPPRPSPLFLPCEL